MRRLGVTIFLSLIALVYAFPVVYMVALSFKDGAEIFANPTEILPRWAELLDPGNYSKAFAVAPLGRFLFNSLVVSASVTLLQVVTAVPCAFALARMQFWGRGVVLALVTASIMIPGEVTIVPNYLTISALGFLDRYPGLVVPFATSGFGIFMLYQYFRSIPKELEEAVIVDGGSKLRFLWQFLVPLSAPAVLAFAVYAFITTWNQYLWPLVATQSTEMRTAQVGLGMFRTENEASSWGVIMAATSVLVLPSIVIFALTQKQFVRGLTTAGIKG